jgi:hypothetical protein
MPHNKVALISERHPRGHTDHGTITEILVVTAGSVEGARGIIVAVTFEVLGMSTSVLSVKVPIPVVAAVVTVAGFNVIVGSLTVSAIVYAHSGVPTNVTVVSTFPGGKCMTTELKLNVGGGTIMTPFADQVL